jgi:hypothetical protein
MTRDSQVDICGYMRLIEHIQRSHCPPDATLPP